MHSSLLGACYTRYHPNLIKNCSFILSWCLQVGETRTEYRPLTGNGLPKAHRF